MSDRVELLIDILLDKEAREDERQDAAMDLSEYIDQRALDALMKIATDPREDIVIVDDCAESIGEICVGLKYFDQESFRKLVPFAQKIVFGYIMYHNSELINQPLRDQLCEEFNWAEIKKRQKS